ncbi:MAG: cadmium-translocating P-type ATPase [Acidobacteriaceae bacterium]|nr:cadmium-translocating P-type ATPase [Acidobacteriaceae bacterium]
MLVDIRHFLPGRVRLYAPDLFKLEQDPDQFLQHIAAPGSILRLRSNRHCSSVVIEYQPDSPGPIADLVLALRRRPLKQLLDRCAESAALPAADKQVSGVTAPRREWWRLPLIAPTISLAIAFSTNALMVTVNVPLMLWNSRPIFRRAWRVLARERRLNVDFLDTLAISVSMLQGAFVTGGIIVWLIRLGDWIRDLTAARSKRAVGELLEFQKKMAWVLRDGTIVSVPVSSLVTGDSVVVHSGEMIPVDGEVLGGCGTIDQKTITGESLPVLRSEGEAVYAATALREGYITIRATRVGRETTAAQIVRLVESAPVGETRIQNHAEMFADRLVSPTLALAVGTAIVAADINRFTSIVIVDYGTGIRVAAPTSVLASMTHAARQGILIKSGAHLEKLAAVDTMVFDKTGTLTSGSPQILDLLCYNERCFPARQMLALAAAAETRLQHPVAEAIRSRSEQDDIQVPECAEVQYRAGRGVEARINGYYVHLGSERFLRECSINTAVARRDQRRLNEEGYSSMMLAIDGTVAGLIPYADQIRAESQEVVAALHNLGIKNTVMLTGDNGTVARAVSTRLGLRQFVADTLPAQKAEFVQELRRKGHSVAMVGDGINDSPALSFADVGIAVKHGAQVAHESANIVLMEDNLWKLIKAIEISRDGVGLIKQNYTVVAAMNTVALALALPGGVISPQMTALISNGSAIIASLNAIRPTLRY